MKSKKIIWSLKSKEELNFIGYTHIQQVMVGSKILWNYDKIKIISEAASTNAIAIAHFSKNLLKIIMEGNSCS